MNFSGLPAVVPGILVVHLVLAGLVSRSRWQRRDRPPVSEKLLRAPGERLRQQLDRLDERIQWLLVGTSLVALATLAIGVSIGTWAATFASVVLFLVFAAAGSWALFRTFDERRTARRSLQGERAVAETLAPLVAMGYDIFHDVPTQSEDPDDNVHHVVIGPGGVFSIETQTHGRRKPLPGRSKHEIIFDGDHLIYPWGNGNEGLGAARRKAEWLSDLIYQVVGERIPVAPVLTLPGWWVTLKTQQRDVGIYNPNQIAALIQHSTGGKLTDPQRAMLTRNLETSCRNVDF
jgi:hypothetical protein